MAEKGLGVIMGRHGPKMRGGETTIRVRVYKETLDQLDAICERHAFGRPGFVGTLIERALFLYQLGGARLFWGGPIATSEWDQLAATVSARLSELEGPPLPDNVVEFPATAPR